MKLNIQQQDQKHQDQHNLIQHSEIIQSNNFIQQTKKSAFRPYFKNEQIQQNTLYQNKIDAFQTTFWKPDASVNPLNHYIFQQLNQFLTLSMVAGGLVSTINTLPETLIVDQSSSDSNKSSDSKNYSVQEQNPDLKRKNAIQHPSGLNNKKCCNCKKSRCLMLYCECFRAGEICQGCNCFSCLNTLQNNTERIQARKKCLQINPFSFANSKRKVLQKGCKCRKSGCRKKYCQCFQQGKDCTELCVCINCQNHLQCHSGHGHLPSRIPNRIQALDSF